MKMNTDICCNPIQRVLQLNHTLGLFVVFCLKVTVLGLAFSMATTLGSVCFSYMLSIFDYGQAG